MAQSTETPVAKAEMLIRKPVAEVFEAFIDPAITSNFWFTKGSGRLEVGKTITWEWEMYGASAEVNAQIIEPNQRIVIEWPGYSGQSVVEWVFKPLPEGTFVSITNSGLGGDDPAKEAIESTEAFTLVLAGLKSYLEHSIRLNLVADRFPPGLQAEG